MGWTLEFISFKHYISKEQLLRALTCVGRNTSTQVDEGKKGWNLLATKMNARAVVMKGGKSLLSDPGSELRLGREKEKGQKREDDKRDIQKQIHVQGLCIGAGIHRCSENVQVL